MKTMNKMKHKLKIMKNLITNPKTWKFILKGLYLYYIKGKKSNIETTKQWAICMGCEYVDNKGDKCLMPGTQPCCGYCGCSLRLKIVSGDHCPIQKW